MLNKTIQIVAYLTISITPIILTYFLKKRYKKLIDACQSSDQSDCKFIFTSYANNKGCKQHVYKQITCNDNCSYHYLTKLVRFLESAKHSISLCMCLSTCIEVQDALIRAHNRGLNVRFISDSEMIGVIASRATILKDAGISIKTPHNPHTLLHHKFCLVDGSTSEEAKLFFGSLNLTTQALTTNWDVVTFTEDKKIIERFQEEFEYLWHTFQEL